METKMLRSVPAAAFFKLATYIQPVLLEEVCSRYGIRNLKALGCTTKELYDGSMLYEVETSNMEKKDEVYTDRNRS